MSTRKDWRARVEDIIEYATHILTMTDCPLSHAWPGWPNGLGEGASPVASHWEFCITRPGPRERSGMLSRGRTCR